MIDEDEEGASPRRSDGSRTNWALRTPAPTPLPERTPVPGSSSNPGLSVPLPPPPPLPPGADPTAAPPSSSHPALVVPGTDSARKPGPGSGRHSSLAPPPTGVSLPLPPPPPTPSSPPPPLPVGDSVESAAGTKPPASGDPETRAFDPNEMAAALGNPLSGTGLEERFLLVDKLGQGGMGTVYLARDRENDEREVALKIVRADKVNDDAMARFKREILCNGFLAHEGVIEIFDGGRTKDGAFYMAMEYFRGEPLSARLKREGPLKMRFALQVLEQVLEALQAIHEANIVHRDIKPENFMVSAGESEAPKVKIMDFGIARILDQEQEFSNQFFRTMEGQLTGSPAYIAPESMSEDDIDPRADLYSLGVAAFELCVGQLPFRASSAAEFLQQHLYFDPPDPCELGAHRNVTPELGAYILKLMSKLPRNRFGSAQEALAVLREQVVPSFDRPVDARATMSFDRSALLGELAEMPSGQAPAPSAAEGAKEVPVQESPEPEEQSGSGWFGRLRKRLMGGS